VLRQLCSSNPSCLVPPFVRHARRFPANVAPTSGYCRAHDACIITRKNVNFLVPSKSSRLSRKSFLTLLRSAGAPVTSSQLQRWTHRGWVSPPTIKGRGRGRGVEATYSGRAVLECYFLAHFLTQTRWSLEEAGWYVWVLGLGDTERIRRLLLDRLQAQRALGLAMARSGRGRRRVEQALEAVVRSRPLRGVRAVLGPEPTLRAVRLITKLRAGLPVPEFQDLTEEQREDLRDAFAQEVWNGLRNALPQHSLPDTPPIDGLPTPDEVPHLLTTELDPTPLVRAVKQWKAPWLRGICSEAQYLLEELGTLFGRRDLLPPEGFLEYVRTQLDRARRPEWEALRKSRGWTSPPPPPLWRWSAFARVFAHTSNRLGGPDDRAS